MTNRIHRPYLPPLANQAMDAMVRSHLYPQLRHFFAELGRDRGQLRIDGVAAMQSNDAFLPGKIALGLGYVLLDTSAQDPALAQRLAAYREIADLTVTQPNQSWGIYYYLLMLTRLQDAGLLDRAISPPTLEALNHKLDWRSFVREADLSLIDLPTNYYGVAFSVARLRMLLGWESEGFAERLLDKTLEHYERYSGDFGFSDETEGEGRFDRYSILLIAEICQRFVQTGLTVPDRLKQLLRKAAVVALSIANPSGHGFSFGRSIGPYGDSAAVEILSVAAYLGVLTAEEMPYAYSYACACLAKYLDFWFNPEIHSVDMWGQGRRTDTYRAKHRILGENFSLIHQFISSNALWNAAGFQGSVPRDDLQAWLSRSQPRFALTWFAKGSLDRALLVYRDGSEVFSLPLINGGRHQHSNSPYYPIPFAEDLIAGIADSGAQHPQLLPKFVLADGSALMATSFIRRLDAGSDGDRHWVVYEQEFLNRLGGESPVADARISMSCRYDFEPGGITRTDRYVPTEPLPVQQLSLDFLSFSAQPCVDGLGCRFDTGRVTQFEAAGFEHCTVQATRADDDFKSPGGPMRTHVQCSRTDFMFDAPLTVRWSLRYA